MGNNRLLREKWDFSRLRATKAGARASTKEECKFSALSGLALCFLLVWLLIAIFAPAQLSQPFVFTFQAVGFVLAPGIFSWIAANILLLSIATVGIAIIAVEIPASPRLQRTGWRRVWLAYIAIIAASLLVVVQFAQQLLGVALLGLIAPTLGLAFCTTKNWEQVIDRLSAKVWERQSRRWILASFFAISLELVFLSIAFFPPWLGFIFLCYVIATLYFLIHKIIRAYPLVGDMAGGLIAIVLIAMAVSKFDPSSSWAPPIESEWLARLEGGARELGSAVQGALASALLAIVFARITDILERVRDRTDRRTDDQNKRLSHSVSVHDDLRSRAPKMLLLGTTAVGPVTSVQLVTLLEIWITTNPDRNYQFSADQLVQLINARMASSASCDVVVTRSRDSHDDRARRVVGYASIEEVFEYAPALVALLAGKDFDGVAALMHSETVKLYDTKRVALERMSDGGLDRIMVVDRADAYVGFCDLEATVREVFAG